MATMTRASLKTRIAAACVATLVASGSAYLVWCAYGGPKSTVEVQVTAGAAGDEPWQGQAAYAIDAIAGLRPARSRIMRMPMVALDDSNVQEVVKHRDANAFLREKPLPDLADASRVILVGDSHLDGVVSTSDNLTTLLEDAATANGTPTAFLNAGCGFYSLWQSVLRACDLIQRYQPKVVVLVVFMGNDFIECDNQSMPHLDDELRHQLALADPPPETTSARKKRVEMIEQYRLLFWQGLNQAMYLMDHPDRLSVIASKAAHAIEHMEREAQAHNVQVLWALLPSFDLAFPDYAKGLGKGVEAVVNSGAQRRMRDAFVAELTKRGSAIVDLETAFKDDGRALTLYAKDFHIYRDGHRVAADVLAPSIDKLLGR
ncbi:MAG: hypothetical protein ACI8UD_002900 [Planctomycetota bacterium]|jgi:hypothetical protein